jgi:lycopene beta-cyclase
VASVSEPPADLLVAGAGPAGLALAGAAAERGLHVVLVAPDPGRAWTQTYGAWLDELGGQDRESVAVAYTETVADGVERRVLGRTYALLDTTALQLRLRSRAGAATVLSGAVVGWEAAPDGGAVAVLADGRRLSAAVGVAATGGPPAGGRRAETAQTAFGLVVERAALDHPDGMAVFMDWRTDHGEAGYPTFLYVLDLGDGRALVEETALAARPPLGFDVLERRLRARLAARGVSLTGHEDVERVHIALDPPPPPPDPVVPYGAAAGFVHPATGYSIAASLAAAGPVADAVVAGLGAGGPAPAAARARAAASPRDVRIARALHRRGREALLAMDPALVPGFFATFLALPTDTWSGFMAARPDSARTLRAMAAMWGRGSWPVRRALVAGALGLPAHRPRGG